MKKKIVICALALVGCAIALLWFYWPQPLIKDIDDAKMAITIFAGDPDIHSGDLIIVKDFRVLGEFCVNRNSSQTRI